MKLNELFVSYTQVDPVKIDRPEPRKIQPLYLNFDRARSVTSPREDEETSEEPTTDMSSWRVQTDETSSWRVGTTSEPTESAHAESASVGGEP